MLTPRCQGGRRRLIRPLLAVLALAASLTSCTASGSHEPSNSTRALPKDLPAAASAYQRQILADGKVTLAEYRASAEKARQCVIDKGFKTTPVQKKLHIIGVCLYFDVKAKAGDPSVLDAASAAQDECEQKYDVDVDFEYANEHKLTGSAREKAMKELVTCLKGAGVESVNYHDRRPVGEGDK